MSPTIKDFLGFVVNPPPGDPTLTANSDLLPRSAVTIPVGTPSGDVPVSDGAGGYTWQVPPPPTPPPTNGIIAYTTRSATVASSGSTFATGVDLLGATPLTITALAGYVYIVRVAAPYIQTTGTAQGFLALNLDGAEGGYLVTTNLTAGTGSQYLPCAGATVLTGLSAGSHTVNIRALVSSGTVNVGAGVGGAVAYRPLVVSIEQVPSTAGQ